MKPVLPHSFLSKCNGLKRTCFMEEREVIHNQFLQQCLDHGVVPKYLVEKIRKRKRNVAIFKSEHSNIIIEEIARRIEKATESKRQFDHECKFFLNSEQALATALVKHFVKNELTTIKKKLRNQLQSLIIEKEAKIFKQNQTVKPVVNLSNRELTKNEYQTLALGMNMTWPSKIKSLQVKTDIEAAYNKISKIEGVTAESLGEIRTLFKCHFDKLEKQTTNLTTSELNNIKNLHNLREDKTLYISKFDKGNGVCVNNKQTYIDKMTLILSDTEKFAKYKPDKRVTGDRFIYAEEQFNRKIKKLFKDHRLDDEILNKITSTGSQPARLYGLPKVHKDVKNPPYRPVLSMVKTYCTNLAMWLDKELKPFIPQERICRDSFEFKEKLFNLSLPQNVHLVSFDVRSLFTSIPVSETIDYILEIIPEDGLPLPKAVMKSLLHMASRNILFTFNGNLYTQHEGMCMGSNLGPTMANFAMHMLESKITQSTLFYQRYVDDIFAIFNNKEEADNYLQHLNSLHENLKFTIEHSKENKITFLDMNIEYKNTTFNTSYHIKATNTGIYMSKKANSPQQYKEAAIRSLIYRAYRLSSSVENFYNTYKIIKLIFVNNGYHHNHIDKIKERTIKQIDNRIVTTPADDPVINIFYKCPFVKSLEKYNREFSKKINSHLGSNGKFIIAYQTNKSSHYFPNKDKVSSDLNSQVVYTFTCGQCDGHTYVGETVRHFCTRRKEHLTGKPVESEVATHQHPPTAKAFNIVLRTKYTKIGEAIVYANTPTEKLINKYRPPFKLQVFT